MHVKFHERVLNTLVPELDLPVLTTVSVSSESRWLIESAAQFYAGGWDKTRYYQDAYTYTTVNPHLALWQHYAYEVDINIHF